MKILFVEDENIKRRDIMNYLSTDLNINDIDVVHSLMGGMLALKKKTIKWYFLI